MLIERPISRIEIAEIRGRVVSSNLQSFGKFAATLFNLLNKLSKGLGHHNERGTIHRNMAVPTREGQNSRRLLIAKPMPNITDGPCENNATGVKYGKIETDDETNETQVSGPS